MLAVWSPLIASMYLSPHRHELMYQDRHLLTRLMNEPFAFHHNLLQHRARALSSTFEELDTSYQLTFGLPGLRASDMTAAMHSDGDQAIVILNGETKTKGHESKVRRRLVLPAGADVETVRVACADGLVTVSALKKIRSEPRVLPVSNDVESDDGDESDDAFRQALLVPGLRADEVKVTLEDEGILVVEGESKRRRPLRIFRRLKLPRNADMDRTSCSLADGVLTLTAPKRPIVEQVEPRDLPVQACLPGECA